MVYDEDWVGKKASDLARGEASRGFEPTKC